MPVQCCSLDRCPYNQGMNTEHDTPSSAPGRTTSTSSESTHSAPQPDDLERATSSANAPDNSTTTPGTTTPGTTTPGTTSASAPTRESLATIKPTPDQIRAARTLANQSQDEAAQLVHVTGRAWRRWESGEREISGAGWELYLIKALGVYPYKINT